tara:strand:- start:8246 stop:8434 length:189 start_codon:yes stop_codon:yes gene_type:complete
MKNKITTLAEHCIDPAVGADKAWDVVHEWLHMHGLEITAEYEEALHNEIYNLLGRSELVSID